MTQPKITGYRQLNPVEADLMNAIKAHGLATQDLINRVQQHLDHQGVAINTGDTALEDQVLVAEPRRWLAMARSDLQTGQMKLVRAVAQPGGF